MEHDWNIGRDFILQIALRVSGSSVATGIVTMVSYLWFIFFERLKANVAPFRCTYPFPWELKVSWVFLEMIDRGDELLQLRDHKTS